MNTQNNNTRNNSRKNTTKPVPKKKKQQGNSNAKVNDIKHSTKAKNNKNAGKKDEIPLTKKAPVVVDVPSTKKADDDVSVTKKLERSNSFIERTFQRLKSTKIYNKLSDSIENLSKIVGDTQSAPINEAATPSPFKFQRSLTLNSFQLKKSYRKNIFENMRLEKLSEEKISESDKLKSPSSPPKSPTPVAVRSRSPTRFRQSLPPGTYENVDFLKPPKLERSDSFISLIKRKISFNESKPPATMNSNWAVSLQNLQQIDNMVSYEGEYRRMCSGD